MKFKTFKKCREVPEKIKTFKVQPTIRSHYWHCQ